VKTIEMDDVAASLSSLVRQARAEPIVITVRGKAVAALTAIDTNTDLENLLVNNDPRFQALIERSRARNPAGTGLSTAEVRRQLRQRQGHRSGRAGSSGKRTIAPRRRAARR